MSFLDYSCADTGGDGNEGRDDAGPAKPPNLRVVFLRRSTWASATRGCVVRPFARASPSRARVSAVAIGEKPRGDCARETMPTPRRTISNGNPSRSLAPFHRSSSRSILPSRSARVTNTSLRTTSPSGPVRGKGVTHRRTHDVSPRVDLRHLGGRVRAGREGAHRAERLANLVEPLDERGGILEGDVGCERNGVRSAAEVQVLHLLQHERRGAALDALGVASRGERRGRRNVRGSRRLPRAHVVETLTPAPPPRVRRARRTRPGRRNTPRRGSDPKACASTRRRWSTSRVPSS